MMNYAESYFITNFFLLCISILMFIVSIRRFKQHVRVSVLVMSIVSVTLLMSVVDVLMAYTKEQVNVPATTVLSFFSYILKPITLVLFILLSGEVTKPKWIYLLIVPTILVIVIYLGMFVPDLRQYIVVFKIGDNGIYFSGGAFRFTAHVVCALYLIYLLYVSIKKIRARHFSQAIDLIVCTILIITATSIETWANPDNQIFLLNTTIAICVTIYYMFLYSESYSHDALTGLFNRAVYFVDLKRMNKNITGLIQFDMNGLKYINDTYGHQKGDEALMSIGTALRNHCDKYMYAYRLGGDEFVILAINASKERIEEFIKSVKDEIQEKGYNCAVGYAYCEHKDDTCMNELFKIAENNMYKDKERFYKESKVERRKV